MKALNLNDTIAAISTPVGKSGIGIVRLSGRQALAIADRVFLNSNGLRPSQFPTHTLHYGWIKDADEVLLSVMRAPKTYTKEDIVEINCHSGIVVLGRILEQVLKRGARLAEPGEFTKRAFLNGRIDLAQAEAVLDIINSQTSLALGSALGQLQGRLSRKIHLLRNNLADILTQLEVSIDFSDQDIASASRRELVQKMEQISEMLKELLDAAVQGTILREGISCVICGRPNVGKSSLLNALLKRERAIVTAVAGTTRDILEETIDLEGIPLRLIDTAGISRRGDLAAREAVKRSRKCLKQAQLILFVLDSSQKLTAEDLNISREIAGKGSFIVLNKQDLPARISPDQAQRLLPGRGLLRVCALRGSGLDRLKKELHAYIWAGKASLSADILVTNIRHKQALSKARRFVNGAIKTAKNSAAAEILALELKDAQLALGEIIGQLRSEDILERIFSQFCIGK